MHLQELLSFEPKTKKHLIKSLSRKNITWKNKKSKIVIENFSIDEYEDIKLVYIINYWQVMGLEIFFNKNSNSLEEIKDNLIKILGIPIRDNSKHKLDHIIVHWNYNNKYINLYQDNTDDIILLDVFFPLNNAPKNENINNFIFSMFGGIVWGVLFFIFFGLGFGYSLFLFVLSMVGGLIWGVLFSICMIKIRRYERRERNLNITIKDKNIFEQYERNNETLCNGIYCIISRLEKRKSIKLKSKIFIQNDKFLFLMLNKKNIITEIKEFKSIKRYIADIDRGNIIINFHDASSIDLLKLDNVEIILQTLDNILGYNTQRFFEINNVVFNCLVEYDPESVILGGAPKEVFLNDAKRITIQIVERNKIDVEIIKYILERTAFSSVRSSGMDGINFDSLTLAINIFDDLEKHNLI